MESNDIKLVVYLIFAILFGPYLAVHFAFIGDYYSLSKTYPIFDEITEEWLLILTIFLYWLGLFFVFSFWNAYKKYQNKPPKLDWWQSGAIYQIYVKSFNDSNGDGVGDLRGIIEKLDYLKSIGVDSIWLTPFYTSGGYDGGYDVTSFVDIDPVYGSMSDFDELVEQVHLRGMHILIDFIPNHTSDQHEWFKQSSKSSSSHNPYRDYYVWYPSSDSEKPPNNWLSVFGDSAWEYCETRKAWYLHQFLKQQPDLNLRCTAVQDELKKVIQFWLETKKVDGMRIDALKHLFESETFECEPIKSDLVKELATVTNFKYDDLSHVHTTNQVETFLLLNDWRTFTDEISKRTKKTKALIVECTYENVNDLKPYYKYKKNEKMAHFPFNFQFCSLNKKNFNPVNLKNLIEDYNGILAKKHWPNWQLGNHDISRVSSRIGNEYIDLANALNLLLGGTPIIYYGEEIGMEDLPSLYLRFEDCRDEFGRRHGPLDYLKHTRDLARTPMQWSSEMSTIAAWLPLHPNHKEKNVEKQQIEPASHLQVFCDLMKLRKQTPTLQWGKTTVIKANEQVLAFTRTAYDFPTYLIAMNLTEENINVNLLVSSSIAPRAYVTYYLRGKQIKQPDLDEETPKEIDMASVYKTGAAVLTKNVFLKGYDCLVLTWYSTN